MVSLYQFAITIGILAAYFTNAQLLSLSEAITANEELVKWIFTDEVWRAMFGSETIPALLFFLLLFFVPRSPRWLMAQNKEQEARMVLNSVVDEQTAQNEMDDIKKVLAMESGSWQELFTPGIRIALFIGMALAILSQFSGINAIIYYGPKIFEQAGYGVGSALNGQVIIGVVNVIFTIIAIWKIDSLGRRILLIVGCSGMIIAHICIGILFYTGNTSGTLLMIFILFFIACFAFSYGPVVWTLLSEMYPTRIRGRAMSLATLSLWIGTYIIGQLVPWMLEVLKPFGTFWIFAVTFVPAILIIWKLVPETKGKSLEEIERYWLEKSH